MSGYVKTLLKQNEMTRNQVAQISGLSNSHLVALENEDIKHIRRDTLLYLLMGLSLELPGINDALDYFSFPRLTPGDIPTFIEATKRRNITGIQPLYAGIGFSILYIALERLGGDLVVVNDKPSSVFKLPEHYAPEEELIINQYPVYKDIKTALHNERREVFDDKLKENSVHNIVCEDCLKEYMSSCREADSTRQYYVKEHFKTLLEYLKNPNYKLDLLKPGRCTYLQFEMKFLTKDNTGKDRNKVFFIGQRKHGAVLPVLNGFATDSAKMFAYFNLEYQRLMSEEHINTAYNDKGLMDQHIQEMFYENTKTYLCD